MKMNMEIPENQSSDEEEVQESDHDEENDNEEYDSMIENGTSDEEEESESDEEEQPKKKPPQKKRKAVTSTEVPSTKKLKSNDLGKPPTLEEINQLNETQNLFHSNLFRFQIEEMLKEIKISKKFYRAVDEWIEQFDQMLKTFKWDEKNRKFSKVCSKIRKKFGLELPIDVDQFEGYMTKEQNFQFIRPGKAKLIGSARQQTLVGPQLDIDLCIEMPKELFDIRINEDHLNGNYFQKRAFYLCFIAAKIQHNDELLKDVKFGYFQNDNLNPILVIKPVGELFNDRVRFNLQICCDEDSFKVSRFSPVTNNARTKRGENLGPEDLLPTPSYNAAILHDLRLISNEEFINDVIQREENVRDAIKLLKIWIKQRQLDGKGIGLNGFILTMIVCHLIQNKKVSKSMSSYQIVRTVWNHLAASDWEKNGITLWKPPFQTSPPSFEVFHQFFDVVFTDQTGYLNILHRVNLDIYNRVRLESQIAINILNDLKTNSFKLLFMTKMPFHLQYDHIISIEDIDTIEYERDLDPFGDKCQKLLRKIVGPLRTGLTNRIISMTPFLDVQDAVWACDTNHSHKVSSINIGLVLNPEYAFDILIKGPSANEPSSTEFRAFWGDSSTLRRFQDGTITEAVVLCSTNDPLPQKRLITKKIVEIVFKNHLNLKNFKYIANAVDGVVETDKSVEEIAYGVIKVFDEVGKAIRLMEDLPLAITAVHGISPVFRYAEPNPSMRPATSHNRLFVSSKIYHGKLQLVPSGKWPTTLEAMRRMKAAFYLKIAQNLRGDKFAKAQPHCDGVDVMRGGHVFRFSITHPKEVALIKKEVHNGLVTKYRDTPTSLVMEKESLMLGKLTSFLHGIYLSNPAFGPSVCLAKQWMYSHNMDQSLVPDECVELLAAQVFLKSQPFNPPNQPQLGFFRFLALLAETDFTNEMVLLNFNEELKEDDIAELDKTFQSSRDSYPPLTIVTSCDMGHHSIWTRNCPTENVLARIVLLARLGLGMVEKNLIKSFNPRLLFKDSLDGFDCLIRLSLREHEKSAAGLDLVEQYLQELREAYDEMALFFFNPNIRDRIAVLFRPNYIQPKDFKTSQVNGHQWNATSFKLEANVKGVLQDFELIGKGLVQRIEQLKKN